MYVLHYVAQLRLRASIWRATYKSLSDKYSPLGALCEVQPLGSGAGASEGLCVDLSISVIEGHMNLEVCGELNSQYGPCLTSRVELKTHCINHRMPGVWRFAARLK